MLCSSPEQLQDMLQTCSQHTHMRWSKGMYESLMHLPPTRVISPAQPPAAFSSSTYISPFVVGQPSSLIRHLTVDVHFDCCKCCILGLELLTKLHTVFGCSCSAPVRLAALAALLTTKLARSNQSTQST
jgi:hypothetical protein